MIKQGTERLAHVPAGTDVEVVWLGPWQWTSREGAPVISAPADVLVKVSSAVARQEIRMPPSMARDLAAALVRAAELAEAAPLDTALLPSERGK